MKLRYAGWVVLTGILLIVRPAFATAPSDSSEPILLPTQKPAVAASEPSAVVEPKTDIVPAAVSPGEIKGEDDALIPPEVAVDGEAAAEPAAPVMPIAALMPLPERNFMKPEVTLKAVIDLTRQRMTVMSGDEVLHEWPISSGRRGYYTPTGMYYPQWRARMWRSRQYDGAPMPYAVFFHRGYAVHGTYATGLLGRPASHGCIRLSNKNAARFFKLVGQHGMESTQIIVEGQTKSAPARVAKRRKSTSRRRVVRRRAPRGYANYSYGSPPGWAW